MKENRKDERDERKRTVKRNGRIKENEIQRSGRKNEEKYETADEAK